MGAWCVLSVVCVQGLSGWLSGVRGPLACEPDMARKEGGEVCGGGRREVGC